MRIRIATRDDIPAAGAIMAAAYIDDEQDAYMFPGRKKYLKKYLKTKESIVRHGMDDPTGTTIVAELEEGDDGWTGQSELMGLCIWYRDQEKDDEKAVEPETKEPLLKRIKSYIRGLEAVEYMTDMLDPLTSASNAATMARTCRLPSSKRYFGTDPGDCAMYGIMDIAVDPRYQGRGVARELVKWGMNKAAEEGVPIELSATPAGSGLYEKLGFKKIGVWRWKPGMEGEDGMGGWDIMWWQKDQ
ncbi:hypothetical protein FOYG_09165 [Fusarium oxysporum NRRL 32931]|uniref:N-acetyltransferase domain-containing protein n=1 Tax=Fusarium oxysporum NRRL 32931 TaxID=660029 RepID=W9HZI5_FUSOX|nr:hypothetical protein FOYG_09165 [Fusarium oxysporum NRRL 32931]